MPCCFLALLPHKRTTQVLLHHPVNSPGSQLLAHTIPISLTAVVLVSRLNANVWINLIKLTEAWDLLENFSGPLMTTFCSEKKSVSFTCHRAVGRPRRYCCPPLVEKDVGCLCANLIFWQLLHITVIKAIPETVHRVLTIGCQKESPSALGMAAPAGPLYTQRPFLWLI